MEENKNQFDAMRNRSLPDHQRSEERMKFDHTLRKPKVSVRKKKLPFFKFGAHDIEFLLLDVSPSGACIIAKDLRDSPFNINDEIIITFPNGIERLAEVRWQLSSLEVPGYEDKKLALGLQMTQKLSVDQMQTI